MKLVLTPRRHAAPVTQVRYVSPEEQAAKIAEGRRKMVAGLRRQFPAVIIIGIQGKSEIVVELPDSEPDLLTRIRGALDVESGPVPGDDPSMPVWHDLPPTLASVEASYRDRQYRPTVVAIVRDGRGRILLVQATRNGEWGVVQGGIEEGEDPIVALGRELGEEIDVGPDSYAPGAYLGCADIPAPPGTADHLTFTAGVRYFVFVVTYRGSGDLVLQKSELSDYAWVEPRFDDARLLECLAASRPQKTRLILAALIKIL